VKARSEEARLRRAKWQVTSGKYQEKEWRKPLLILGTCYLKPETLRARVRAYAESEYLVPKGSRVPPRKFLRAASAKSSSQNEA
jgi:hypothetical protein